MGNPNGWNSRLSTKKYIMKSVFSALLVLLSVSCNKDKTEIWVTYTMTQCSDPWQNSPDYGRDKEGTLRKFLEEKDITVLDLNIKLDSACAKNAVCTACTCTSCLVASVQIYEHDLVEMEKLKFRRK